MARRGDGIYQRGRVWYFDARINGVRHVERIGRGINRTIAAEIASVRRASILRGEAGIGKKRADISFKDAKNKFLAELEANQRPTEFHAECFRMLEKAFGEKSLGQITRNAIEAYKQSRVKNGRGCVAVNRELAVFSRLYNWCRDQKPPLLDGENPVSGVKRFKESEGRIRFLEWEEEARLLEAAKEPLRSIILCGTDAGLRLEAEALTLKWSGLDFRRGVLIVECAHAKNGEMRSIPLTDRLKQALVAHRFRAGKREPEEHVFLNRDGEPFGDKGIRTAFHTARNAARLGEDVTPHTCRHTFGSRLAMAGKDVRTIQELMGHKRIEMTIRYTHVSDEHKAAAVRTGLVPPAKIPQPFSQQPAGEAESICG